MKTLTFLLAAVIELYTMIMLLRVWMQWALRFYNPFSQFIVKVAQPVVGPLRRIIPAIGPIDSSSLLIAFILCVVKPSCCLWWSPSSRLSGSPRC